MVCRLGRHTVANNIVLIFFPFKRCVSRTTFGCCSFRVCTGISIYSAMVLSSHIQTRRFSGLGCSQSFLFFTITEYYTLYVLNSERCCWNCTRARAQYKGAFYSFTHLFKCFFSIINVSVIDDACTIAIVRTRRFPAYTPM